jgi:serine/threonine protein kinase
MELAVTNLYKVLHYPEKLTVPIPLSSPLKIQWLYEVAKGLRYLHTYGVIHRDLKPQNILLFYDEATLSYVAKIADFGVSTAAQMTSTRGTSHGDKGSVGTAQYMAPELHDPEPSESPYTKAVDIFSYGILINELLTGEIPWKGHKETAIAIGVLSRSLRPKLFAQDGANAVEAVISQLIGDASRGCLAQEKNARPSIREICKELETVEPSLLQGPSRLLPVAVSVRVQEDVVVVDSTPVPSIAPLPGATSSGGVSTSSVLPVTCVCFLCLGSERLLLHVSPIPHENIVIGVYDV